ncbi:MAG: penicillin-binding protein 1C [Bacteroidetes bacterium]|nr:penicillin-binding protein 1C [Bacteroidota bacterium]MBI3482907.1 penicillin-binding protein 1C [Bacteroidota bacterium]
MEEVGKLKASFLWLKKKIVSHPKITASFILVLAIYYFSLPASLFEDPYSTVLEDRHENLLSAAIASDGQWRFPEGVKIPDKFRDAVVLFEDKRFFYHPGIDPMSLGRAIRQNISSGKIVSGGSTISMQVIRLSRKNKSRTYLEKIIEIILATRLELRYSKEQILGLYSSHAPFGGNVVGIEAACWRFFGRSPEQLSWAEAALLAVLPNNPSLIHLGKNRERLKEKRDRLLERLQKAGKIDALALDLAKSEPVPESPLRLPKIAPHLLTRFISEGKANQKIITTLDIALQQRTRQIVHDHHQQLKGNQIFNAAAIVISVKTGNVLAYIGNTESGRENNEQVDVVNAPRSTGSILKPFLFAAMLNEGKMLQHTLIPDVPVIINGYSPKNFSKEYDGAVAADQALIRSLNVPAVHELRDYRYEKFYELLKNIGFTQFKHPADHYGLSLVLGGAEGTLFDITSMYASMARTLENYFEHPGKNKYNKRDFHRARVVASDSAARQEFEENSFLSASSIYLTFDALLEVYRPGEESGWKYFNNARRIAWKTGTSFGFRDGWAVGVNPDYAVGVWVGNADGEGRPGLTGTETAAPLMFDIFSSLPGNNVWFSNPKSEMTKAAVCSKSGFLATSLCESTGTIEVAHAGLQTLPCRYHQRIHLSPDQKFRVHSECVPVSKIKTVSWFVLPPVQEYYFKTRNISYKPLPPFRRDCENPSSVALMDLIYPKLNAKVYVPRELNGESGQTIFEAVHRNPSITVYWHIDGDYVGSTSKLHRMALSPSAGNHILTLVDENGETIRRSFKVISGS